MNYVEHVVKPGCLKINAAHTKSLAYMQHYHNFHELRSFLSIWYVHRRLVPLFTNIAAPIYCRLKKDIATTLYPLGDAKSASFSKLVKAINTLPVLDLPKAYFYSSVDTDTGNYQMRAAILQTNEEGVRKPVRFWYRSLHVHEKQFQRPKRNALLL